MAGPMDLIAALADIFEDEGEDAPPPKRARAGSLTLDGLLNADTRRRDGTLSESGGKVSWANWGGSVVDVRLAQKPQWPKKKAEVQKIIADISSLPAERRPHLRVAGHGHSWTPIVCSDDEALIFCRDFEFDDGSKIRELAPHPDGAKLIQVCGGVTTGMLANWIEEKYDSKKIYPGLSADVVLDNVRYAGVIACGCHGAGWEVQTISDMVHSMTVINYKGEEIVYNASHPDFYAAKASFGLLGVVFDLTLKMDNNTSLPVVEVIHSKPKQRDFFADTDKARETLKTLVESHYAVEMLWFPLNTYPVSGFKPKTKWDPLGDRIWVKLFQRAKVPAEGISTPKFSDPGESLRSFLTVRAGGGLKPKFEKFARHSMNPSLSAMFAQFALDQADDETEITSLPRAIHWQKNVDDIVVNDLEFCFKVDPDFSNVQKAWRVITTTFSRWINDKYINPMNIAAEWRFTAHSDTLLSPAYGKPGDHFCWIEILSLQGTENWEEFADEVATAWMEIPGAAPPKPHWAKWNAIPGKPDIVADYAKKVFASEIMEFATIVKRSDPEGMFQTKWLKNLFEL